MRGRPGHGSAQPAKVVIINYPEGQAEEVDAVNNPEDASSVVARCPSRASSTSSRTTSWSTRRRSSSASRPAAKSGCAMATSSRASTCERRERATWSNSAAPTIPTPAAATRPTAARSRAPCTGCRPRTPSPPRSGSTIDCSTSRIPGAGDSDFVAQSIRRRSRSSATPGSNPRWPMRPPDRSSSSNGSATSPSTLTQPVPRWFSIARSL